MERQSWESCKYSAKGRVGCCSEFYSCLNEKIAELGVYSKLKIDKDDGSSVVSSTLFNHSHLSLEGKISLEWPKIVFLQAEIDKSLAGCRHCKFHEYRTGKQTKFGKLKKMKKGDEEYTVRELKIIDS